tara:strand:+ start:1491 stop:2345 length:855 start_codon:yes stop_codon:yes gene_type:complete
MNFKRFFFLLINDPFWIFYPLLKLIYNFKKKKLLDSYYKNQLDSLVSRFDNVISENKIDQYTPVDPNLSKQIPPKPIDLSRLYNLMRAEKPFTVLEFGVGYSTLVIAKALKENEEEFNKQNEKEIRNTKMFKLYVVDTQEKWIENLKKNIPNELKKYIVLSQSDIHIKLYNGQVCHFYDKIPDINPEFIYLDGPHPLDPEGDINGLSFKCFERTPIAADICLLESTLLPGCNILVDGRTNNVRFLKNNLKRNYSFKWDRIGDVTLITLKEKKLGKLNKLGFEYY